VKIKPKNYELRSIKVLGKIGNYLVMENVKNMELDWGTYNKIVEELYDNFLHLARKDNAMRIPQIADILVSGKREDGKFIVYLAYDYP